MTLKILLDSRAPSGARLTTFEVRIPKFLLAQLNTHRSLSKSAASSRAIPINRTLEAVENDPFVPTYWGKNKKGMSPDEELSDDAKDGNKEIDCVPCYGTGFAFGSVDCGVCKYCGKTGKIIKSSKELSARAEAKQAWLKLRDRAIETVRQLDNLGLHKELANRLIEPWAYSTVIISATTFRNFFKLRSQPHTGVQRELQTIAAEMLTLYKASTPTPLTAGEWHLPLIRDEDREQVSDIEVLRKVSVGRCARVSYLTHDGRRDLQADVDLHDRLLVDAHMTPFEHVAQAAGSPIQSGNFKGFIQYRKLIPGEAGLDFELDDGQID